MSLADATAVPALAIHGLVGRALRAGLFVTSHGEGAFTLSRKADSAAVLVEIVRRRTDVTEAAA